MKAALIPRAFPSTTSEDLHSYESNTGFTGVSTRANADEEREFISGSGSRAGAWYYYSILLKSATEVKT